MITTSIDTCVDALRDGELVAFPTETVFGLGARADAHEAVAKIFDAKGRPHDHPLISHCATTKKALSAVKTIPDYARVLAEKFWPGPMTLIFIDVDEKAICSATRGGHATAAIRVPSHPKAQELLVACDFFVAAPSANKFGRVSPTTSEHVANEFDESLLILDGEQSQCGVESTIISCVGEIPVIVREGSVTEQDIIDTLNLDTIKVSEKHDAPASPGTLASHYAPSIPVNVYDNEAAIALDSRVDPFSAAYLGMDEPNMVFSYSDVPASIEAFAHDLYAFFREAEKRQCSRICVIAPPESGVGVAINDRLRRAAHSHPEK